jgi:7-carboxy-7-deazaguanine synthase
MGWPTVFVRLTGCPLRCGYCDSAYAFHGGSKQNLTDIVDRVRSFAARRVCVTGGEPLAQRGCIELLRILCDEGLEVSLETSGAIDISAVDPRVSRVMDLKTPGSGEMLRNRLANLPLLNAHDQLKFVICDRADYDWACTMLETHALHARCEVLFSASQGQLHPGLLADWILADRLPVRLQLQMHKYLWGDVPGR